jgi:uncharacterized protein with GYD domain
MAKFLVQFNYTAAGMKGVMQEGGSARRAAVEKAVQSLGGKLEAYYFAFGEADGFSLLDMPDNCSMAAANMAVALGGGATTKTTVLLTPEEVDEAVKQASQNKSYRAPGQ